MFFFEHKEFDTLESIQAAGYIHVTVKTACTKCVRNRFSEHISSQQIPTCTSTE